MKGKKFVNILDGHALKEQIHSCASHYQCRKTQTYVNDILDPFVAIRNSNQCKANGPLDCDESKAPRLLKNIKPLRTVVSKPSINKFLLFMSI